MGWLEIGVQLRRDQAPAAEAVLIAAGALSLSLRDHGDTPILEPAAGAVPLWPQLHLEGLFPPAVDPQALRRALQDALGTEVTLACRSVGERDWQQAWRRHARPRRFGRRLWVLPEADTSAARDGLSVVLAPGLAFGTGAHATTALCLEWLDAHPPRHRAVIDYGCGSGVLGIAAARLGAHRVLCVDNDPQAREAARRNAARNPCNGTLTVHAPDRQPGIRVALILANILARPLLGLGPRFADWLTPGGKVVLSGVLTTQCDALCAWYLNWFVIEDTAERDGWVRICAVRRHPVR